MNDAKTLVLNIFNKDCCDQIAADNEENIYADKSTAKKLESSMEQDDRDDSKCS